MAKLTRIDGNPVEITEKPISLWLSRVTLIALLFVALLLVGWAIRTYQINHPHFAPESEQSANAPAHTNVANKR